MLKSKLTITPYADLADAYRDTTPSHVVSILGGTDGLAWPSFPSGEVLRLQFDDTYQSSGNWIGPNRDHIDRLIRFARRWAGQANLLVHCRAGTSRSSAAALVCLAAISRQDLLQSTLDLKSYFRPNRRMLELADLALAANGTLLALRAADRPKPDVVGPTSLNLHMRREA
jgi:predicted protein tyrosine phosphatase